MSELPQGWARVLLTSAALSVPTRVPAFKGAVEYYSTGSIQPNGVEPEGRFTFQSRPARANRWSENGDVLQARMQGTDKGILISQQLANRLFSTGFLQLRPHLDICDARFLSYYVRSPMFLLARDELATGSTQVALTDAGAQTLTIPLAPLEEQRRIVTKLEELFAKVDPCQKRLEKITVLLKRFRQSILAAACSGRLTADWRERNPVVEPANKLLIRIQEKRVSLATSKKEHSQILEAFEERNLCLDDGELGFNDIPDSWVTCRVGAIGSVCNGSTPSRKELKFWNGNIPWVSSGEVRNNIISETRECITKAGYENSSVRLLPCGTVLLAMIGEGKTRGQSAVLNIKATINQNIAAVILEHGLVRSDYLWHWFQLQYEATRERGSGSGPQALNCQRVRELPFALPPLDEQQEVVRRTEALFTVADKIEARYAKAKIFVDKLTQSNLAKAFRGELVCQDPSDEPAERLLERLKSAKNQSDFEPKRKEQTVKNGC